MQISINSEREREREREREKKSDKLKKISNHFFFRIFLPSKSELLLKDFGSSYKNELMGCDFLKRFLLFQFHNWWIVFEFAYGRSWRAGAVGSQQSVCFICLHSQFAPISALWFLGQERQRDMGFIYHSPLKMGWVKIFKIALKMKFYK